jgi:hypothetical protein
VDPTPADPSKRLAIRGYVMEVVAIENLPEWRAEHGLRPAGRRAQGEMADHWPPAVLYERVQ